MTDDTQDPPSPEGGGVPPDTEEDNGAAQPRFTALSSLVLTGLVLLAVAQAYFLAQTMRGSKAGKTPPPVGSFGSGQPPGPPGGPGQGPRPNQGSGPNDGPPGPGSSGDAVRMIVPPNVLFKAIVTMQADPSTRLGGETLSKMKDLLSKWAQLDETIATQIEPAVRSRIAALTPAQRQFVDSQAGAIPRGPPELEKLVTVLTTRAGEAQASPTSDTRDGEAYAKLEPEALVGVLLKLNDEPSLALTPLQAASLLKPVSEWKSLFDKYLDLMGGMTDLLNDAQRGIVMRLKDEVKPDDFTSVDEARRALEK